MHYVTGGCADGAQRLGDRLPRDILKAAAPSAEAAPAATATMLLRDAHRLWVSL